MKKRSFLQDFDANRRRRFAARHPELEAKYTAKRAHAAALLRNHGISRADYEYLFRVQRGKCAACDRKEADAGQKRLAVDHCHITGRTRGLLCGACNLLLGRIREDADKARAMGKFGLAQYVERRCDVAKSAGQI